MKVIIVGGVAGGASCAARQLGRSCVLWTVSAERSGDSGFSSCHIVTGFSSWQSLRI